MVGPRVLPGCDGEVRLGWIPLILAAGKPLSLRDKEPGLAHQDEGFYSPTPGL